MKFIKFILKHKFISLIILAIIIAAGYFGYQKINPKKNEVRYLTAKVEKGMLISSISGTGQVSASNQVDIKPKVSGDIVLVNVKTGQKVKQGQLIAQIETRDAARKISEAEASLENAKLDLEELLAPVDNLTLIQAENSLADAQDSLIKLKTTQANNYQETLKNKQDAEDNLEKAYEDAYNDIANAFLDLPTIMTGLYTTLFSTEIADSEPSVIQNSNKDALINSFSLSDDEFRHDFEHFVNNADSNYKKAKNDYDQSLDGYKEASRYSDKAVIEQLLEQTIETTKKIADAIKSQTNMFDNWTEYRTNKGLKIYSKVTTYQSNLASYTSKINSHFSNLFSAQKSIEGYEEDILQAENDLKEMAQNHPLELAQAERNMVEKQEKLNDLKSGATELEIKNKQLAIQQKQNSLIEAQQNYADYFIHAPFNGTIVALDVAKGDNISGSTVIATLITDQKIAEVTLNEIDAAKVKIGQKATLNFDAIEDLSITGEVVEVDTLGTVTQGVVSYDIKITFDVQDERVKPGMSVSVNIITESKLNVLLAPLSAVKTSTQGSYVEILIDGQIQRKKVVVGSSSDTMIEITDGLTEGEEIVTQTLNNGAGSSNTTNTQNSRRNEGPPMGGMMMIR